MGYLERNPCPDLEDEQLVARFARLLAERVPAAQARLRRTLESSVGPLVCRAILAAFSSRDFDQLPPHLREPMREARKKTGGESIRSPYLRYNPENGSMEVVLPKQSSRLADFNSCWVLGTNSYNALIERTLAVEDLPGARCQIGLTRLRNQFQDQIFTVKLTPDEQDPFFVFRASDGRRLQVGLRPLIELPLGDYHLILPIEHKTNEEDAFAVHGRYKAAMIEIFPGRDDLEISVEKRKAVLRPRLGSDLIIQDQAGKKLQSVGGVALFYGDELDVQAFTPVGSSGDSEIMRFKIECVENPSVESKKLLCEKAGTKGAYLFYDLSAELVQPFLSGLPAGIHEVQISVEGRARNFSRRFFYWKGFRRTTKSFGYVCDEAPENFDATTSVGVRKTHRGLQICEDHYAPEVLIGIKRPSRTFTLAKPGIWLRLTDLERLDSRPIALGKSIEVNSSEQLIVESGDTLPWEIHCDHTTLAVLKPGQAKHTMNLGALLSQFGESCLLEAKNATGQTQTLIAFSKANLARDLKVQASPEDLLYRASFRIGRLQVRELEVDVANFADKDVVSGPQRIEVAEGESTLTGFASNAVKLRFTADEADWVVELEANLATLPTGVYFVDFKARKEGQTRWQPLKVADTHGLSESRLVIATDPVCEQANGVWSCILKRASENPDLDSDTDGAAASANISEQELKPMLDRLQGALLFKYASPVWPSIQWLEAALVRLCQESYSGCSDPVYRFFTEVAVSSLSQKSESSVSIHSTLVFGSQELLLTQRGSTFAEVGPSETQIGRVFKEIGRLADAKSLKEYAATNFSKGCAHGNLLNWFANFPKVVSNREQEFKCFDHQHFFAYLAEQSQELDFKQAEISVSLLLTPEHFLTAIRALNRRFRPLEQARNSNETGASLGRLNQEIQACGNRLDQAAPTVKGLVGFPNYLDLSIPINIAESVLVQVVSDLLLTVTGLGRLTANGLLSCENYLQGLEAVLSPGRASLANRTHRLCLLMSLAPELFAFYMLFWEATLKPRVIHERN
jgi:hypothetical protein